jgi:L-ribulokinase
MQICADVLNAEIRLAESEQSVALGAAILGRLAAEAEPPSAEGLRETIGRMARVREDLVYRPGANAKRYGELYRLYRDLGAVDGVVAATMRRLRELED